MDANGDPFPTLFWLTCPDVSREVSRLESEGWISRLNERACTDPEFASALARAHAEYAAERARFSQGADEHGGVGGTREGVKCLHAHYANFLAGGEDEVGMWVSTRIEPIHRNKGGIAAVDIGTNSIRLLVVTADGRELARDMVITRLGRDVDSKGVISTRALAGTLEVLRSYCRRARALGVERIHAAATSAVRDSTNREELEKAVAGTSGSPLEVLSGKREAELSFLGATRRLAAPQPFLVVDIGGGSTEFTLGSSEPQASISVQTGSVRLTERHLRSDPPTGAELEALDQDVSSVLAEVERALAGRDARTLIAVGGTPTTAQAIALGLTRYDPDSIHLTRISRETVESVLASLEAMTNSERAAMPVMAPGRADVIVAGVAILAAIMGRFGFADALVSEEDILDGLAAEMLVSEYP